MPRKVRRADLFFINSGPSGPSLRRLWRKLPIRQDGRTAWDAPSLLAGRSIDNLEEEAELAIEEQALLPIREIAHLPAGFNLVLFQQGEWCEPAAVVEGELIEDYRRAIEHVEPLLFEEQGLFGTYFWKLTPADELLDADHLRLEFLEAVDSERRRYERLAKRYERGLDDAEAFRRERIPEEVRMLVWRRDEGMCVQCGSQERLEFDHIIPVSRGGANTARNIQLLCERCNREKGARI